MIEGEEVLYPGAEPSISVRVQRLVVLGLSGQISEKRGGFADAEVTVSDDRDSELRG